MANLDGRQGFLEGFARGASGQRFTEFHESGGDSPITVAGLDRALAKQYLAVAFCNAADHDQWILVMNLTAIVTDRTFSRVVLGNFAANRAPATWAVLHRVIHFQDGAGSGNRTRTSEETGF